MKDLKTYRDLKNWSQAQLAEKAGVHSQTIFKIENQMVEPSEDVKIAIERTFQVPVNWLSTCGTDGGEKKSWHELERDLRTVLVNAKKLPSEELNKFFAVAQEYVSTLESIVKLERAEADDGPLLPPDVYYELKQRARGGK
jgi:DNA-binding XRE family transcriptional regulator